MPFSFEPLDIPAVVRVDSEVYHDERGFLLESYDRTAFREAGIETEFVLDFYSRSEVNVLRGLHFQRPPFEQAKLVYCSAGEIFDVAVDIRPESETYGRYVSLTLDDSARAAVYIPSGFAHGFAVTDGPAMVHYKASSEYAPKHQGGVRWNDPDIGIDWPFESPTVSDRDAGLPQLADLETLG